jgi:hypothetical protein
MKASDSCKIQVFTFGAGEMKSVIGNFLKYPFQMLFVLLVLIITQICGLLGKAVHFIFFKDKIFEKN